MNVSALWRGLANPLRSQAGFSIIQIMVASGLVVVIAAAVMNLMESQRRLLSATEQKQDILALRAAVLQQVDLPQICGWQFRDVRFDSTGITATHSPDLFIPIRDNTIYGGDSANRLVLVAEGQRAGRSPASPRVSSIRLANFRRAGNDRYMADLMVSFDPATSIVAMRDVQMASLQFVTDPATPVNNKRIINCASRTSLYTGWPDTISCGNTVYRIRAPGEYHCFRGGEVTTRSSIITWDPVTRRASSYSNETDSSSFASACQCGSCCTDTMDELIENGLTR